MARNGRDGSALSEPRNFIAESTYRRFYRHHRRALASCAAIAAVTGIAVTTYRLGSAPGNVTVARQAGEPQDSRREPSFDRRPTWTSADFRAGAVTNETAFERAGPQPPLLMPSVTLAATDQAAAADGAEPGAVESRKAAAPETETVARIAPPADSRPDGPRPEPRPGVGDGPDDAFRKAEDFLRRGQYTVARYIFRDLFDKGDPRGATGMAHSYDAEYLRGIGRRARGDPDKARSWYRRAEPSPGGTATGPGR